MHSRLKFNSESHCPKTSCKIIETLQFMDYIILYVKYSSRCHIVTWRNSQWQYIELTYWSDRIIYRLYIGKYIEVCVCVEQRNFSMLLRFFKPTNRTILCLNCRIFIHWPVSCHTRSAKNTAVWISLCGDNLCLVRDNISENKVWKNKADW